MRRAIVLTVCLFIGGFCWAVYALFHGYFDHGHFQIEQVQWSAQKKVAVIFRRSDNEALNGDNYYILLGDHVFTLEEARLALYSDQVLFRTSDDCLAIRWLDASHLEVTCRGHSIGPDQIDDEKDHAGDVRIVYKNISHK